jgi:hypothetical protein
MTDTTKTDPIVSAHIKDYDLFVFKDIAAVTTTQGVVTKQRGRPQRLCCCRQGSDDRLGSVSRLRGDLHLRHGRRQLWLWPESAGRGLQRVGLCAVQLVGSPLGSLTRGSQARALLDQRSGQYHQCGEPRTRFSIVGWKRCRHRRQGHSFNWQLTPWGMRIEWAWKYTLLR